jgi:hypothetical protein
MRVIKAAKKRETDAYIYQMTRNKQKKTKNNPKN